MGNIIISITLIVIGFITSQVILILKQMRTKTSLYMFFVVFPKKYKMLLYLGLILILISIVILGNKSIFVFSSCLLSGILPAIIYNKEKISPLIYGVSLSLGILVGYFGLIFHFNDWATILIFLIFVVFLISTFANKAVTVSDFINWAIFWIEIWGFGFLFISLLIHHYLL